MAVLAVVLLAACSTPAAAPTATPVPIPAVTVEASDTALTVPAGVPAGTRSRMYAAAILARASATAAPGNMPVASNADSGSSMSTARVVGAVLAARVIPMTMARLGRDPAVGASVLITAVTDSGGFFIFLGLASLLLL